MTGFLPRSRPMRNMTGICVIAIIAAALQGCGSSGTVAAGSALPSGAPVTGTAPVPVSASTAAAATSTAADTAAPATSSQAAPTAGGWTPQGQLADPEPIDQTVNPDKSVTATWPKGAPAGHALTVKLQAVRNGGKIVIHLRIDNESGQQVSMSEGLFTGGEVLDAQGNTLNMENFDPLWTLGSGSADGNIDPGQPLAGDFVVDAPAAGSTLNAYWTQATPVNGIMAGIILIRDIPIS